MKGLKARLVLGWLAVIGPVAFTLAWLLAGLTQDGYSPRREDISALAAVDAQHPWIMITGFLLLGIGTMALGVGLLVGALRGRAATIGGALVLLAGVALVVAGLARNDCSSELPACADRVDAGDVSWHHTTHDLVSLVLFLALIAAPLVLARAFRQDERWADLRTYSIVTGLLGLALLIVYGSGVAGSWNGLAQRLFVSVLFLGSPCSARDSSDSPAVECGRRLGENPVATRRCHPDTAGRPAPDGAMSLSSPRLSLAKMELICRSTARTVMKSRSAMRGVVRAGRHLGQHLALPGREVLQRGCFAACGLSASTRPPAGRSPSRRPDTARTASAS